MSYRLLSTILDHSPVRGLDRFVFIVLAEMADKRTGECRASFARIAARTTLARSRVQTAVARLEAAGAVVVIRAHRQANRYRVLPPPTAGEPTGFDTSERYQAPDRLIPQGGTLDTSGEGFDTSGRSPSGLGPVRIQKDSRCPPSADSTSRSVPRPPDPRPPDSRIATLLRAFSDAHQAALGQPYPVAGGRDGAALRRALRTWEAAAITATLPAYFADDWRCANGPTVAKWVALLPSLLRRSPAASSRFVG